MIWNKYFSGVSDFKLLFLFIIVLLSRIPFIWEGYGVEEDSWGLVVNACEMRESGQYVISRLPGHPFQEIILSLFPHPHAWLFNGLSAVFSIIAVLFFFLWLRNLRFKYPFVLSLGFAFVPVVYISSVYTIDYMWALAFLCGAFYFKSERKFLLAGIFLGLAGACRLSSLMMAIPFLVMHYDGVPLKWVKNNMVAGISALSLVVLFFIPVWMVYGWDFFGTYSLPYPPLAKVVYKGSIGVWSLLGLLALGVAIYYGIKDYRANRKSFFFNSLSLNVKIGLWLGVGLHMMLYILLPEKSAFWIPAIPLILILLGYYVRREGILLLIILLFVASPFFLSVNLTDPYRGADSSPFSVRKTIAGQEVFFDVATGPIFNDLSKRKNKRLFCESVLEVSKALPEGSVVISEWWYNQLEAMRRERGLSLPIQYVPWLSIAQLKAMEGEGIELYCLLEVKKINERRIGDAQALKNVKAFPLPKD